MIKSARRRRKVARRTCRPLLSALRHEDVSVFHLREECHAPRATRARAGGRTRDAGDISLRVAVDDVLSDEDITDAERRAVEWHIALMARDDCGADDPSLSRMAASRSHPRSPSRRSTPSRDWGWAISRRSCCDTTGPSMFHSLRAVAGLSSCDLRARCRDGFPTRRDWPAAASLSRRQAPPADAGHGRRREGWRG
jgi:hypothetical protein